MDYWHGFLVGMLVLGVVEIAVVVGCAVIAGGKADDQMEVIILSKLSPVEHGLRLVDEEVSLDDYEDRRIKRRRVVEG